MPIPGATRSGFAAQSRYVGPRELKLAIVSSPRRRCAVRARRADGQDPGRVARRRDAAVLRQARRVLAEVAGGRDDDDAGVDHALGGERQRVGPGRLVNRRADRHVDDADVVRRVIREHPIERRDDVADGPVAGVVEDAQRDDAGVWRGAGLEAARIEAVAGDDAGDVRAVAVSIVRRHAAVHKVDERLNPLVAEGIERARPIGQVVMPARDTGVDDRDANARAREAERLLDGPRADRERGRKWDWATWPGGAAAQHRWIGAAQTRRRVRSAGGGVAANAAEVLSALGVGG